MILITTGIGFLSSLFFMLSINEPKLTREAIRFDYEYKKLTLGIEDSNRLNLDSAIKKPGKNWKAWLREPTFYIFGMVYMLVRVAVNVTMSMQPFYLEVVTGFKGDAKLPTPLALAIVPLISSTFSMLFSIFLQ